MGAKREGSDFKTRKKKEILPQKRERERVKMQPPPTHTQNLNARKTAHGLGCKKERQWPQKDQKEIKGTSKRQRKWYRNDIRMTKKKKSVHMVKTNKRKEK